MSGVELIVGVVLGSIPIAIEVYNRSGKVFEVFSAFKQYPREVSILDAKLSVQRTIFRNNAINLLTAITKDQEYVLEIINRPVSTTEKSDLTMAPVYRNQIDALEESFESCARTADHIRGSLMILCSQSDDFRAEVGERQDDVSTSEWMKHVKTRFRLAMSKPKMEQAITELRELNRDFGLIADQIIKHLQQVSNEVCSNRAPTRRPVKSLNVLQRYHRVRYASKALYSTLQVQWNCNTHQYHSFDVRIIDGDLGKGKGKTKAALSRYVTCELAVTHDGSLSSPKAPLYLEIQQACDSDDEELDAQVGDGTNIQQLTKVLETDADRLEIPVSTGKKSRFRGFLGHFKKEKPIVPTPTNVAFIPELPKLAKSLSSFHLSDQSSQPSSSSSTDLSRIDDICKLAYNNVACCTDKSLLGSWSGPHAQWFCLPAALSTTDGGSWALSDMIRWIDEEPVLRSLPRPILVELAGNVAEGIMQFYSTPWLSSTDLGQNVRYLGPGRSSPATVQLKGPYFMTRFQSGKRESLSLPASNISSGKSITVPVYCSEARNQLLFNFGILMLEIGYGRPWHKLKQAITATHEKLTDYKIAEKLASHLVSQLGPSYAKIIRKCLGCDFGLGETDLDNEDLQRRFLEDVAAGLQQVKDSLIF